MCPLWYKVVIATGITVYCCLKATYFQYVDNFFEQQRAFLSKLPNPDYYGRLGQACYETLILKMKKIKEDDQQLFVSFVFHYEFNGTKITQDNKLCLSFLKHYTKLEQPFNKERCIM